MKPSYGILNIIIMSSHVQNNHILYLMSSILKMQHNLHVIYLYIYIIIRY